MGRVNEAAADRRGTAASQVREALQRGAALTRVEACERYGITGSTFRWVIKRLRDDGATLEFELVEGGRGSVAKRWRMIA